MMGKNTYPPYFTLTLLIAGMLTLAGCGSQSATRDGSEDMQIIIPGERIGPFVIGQSSRAAILGQDTPEKRQKYFDQGIEFTFNQYNTLSAITIHTNQFETPEGISVGSPLSKVREVYGEPIFEEINDPNGEFTIPGHVYDGITFLDYQGSVAAIIVMEELKAPPKFRG